MPFSSEYLPVEKFEYIKGLESAAPDEVHAALLAASQGTVSEKPFSVLPAATNPLLVSEPDYLHIPDAFVKEPQAKPPEAKPQDWFHDACSWVSGATDVAAQVVVGAASRVYQAVTEHPLDTAIMVAEGAAVGVAVVGAAPLAAALGAGAVVVGGVAVAADATLVGLSALGVAAAGRDTIEAVGQSTASADVLMHKSAHTEAELLSARRDLQAKTGQAAIEVVAAAAMTAGTWGSGVRLVEGAGKSFGKIGGSLDRVAAPELPEQIAPDSARALMEKFDQVIAQRQEQVDVADLYTRMGQLRADGYNQIWVREAGQEPRLLTSQELYSEKKTRAFLQDKPAELAAFETYLSRENEFWSMNSRVNAELNRRAGLVSQVINQHAPSLFPQGTVPRVQVKLFDFADGSQAAYGNGELLLRPQDLERVSSSSSYERAQGELGLAEIIVHEMKHAEQQGLLTRNYIDRLTAGDTTDRPLTREELSAVQELTRANLKTTFPDHLIEDVNRQRAGRVLSSQDARRAAALEKSFRQFADDLPRQNENYSRASRLSQAYDRVRTSGVSQDMFESKYLEDLFGRNNVPPQLLSLTGELEAPVLEAALARESELARAAVARDFAAYKNLLHEAEAFKAGGEAAAQISAALS
ncbi:MAG: hypothetical protein JST01_09000 [Cyanobacteria bacterium SZAS TMP-1]|nr:hypothetical protein [Cyanobacteria bacterium SZAS TMP-1]